MEKIDLYRYFISNGVISSGFIIFSSFIIWFFKGALSQQIISTIYDRKRKWLRNEIKNADKDDTVCLNFCKRERERLSLKKLTGIDNYFQQKEVIKILLSSKDILYSNYFKPYSYLFSIAVNGMIYIDPVKLNKRICQLLLSAFLSFLILGFSFLLLKQKELALGGVLFIMWVVMFMMSITSLPPAKKATKTASEHIDNYYSRH